MFADRFNKVDSTIEKFLPYLFLVLCFTAPFANNIAGHAYLICIVLFITQLFFRKEYQTGARAYYIVVLIYLAVVLLSLIFTSDIEEGFRHYKQQCKILISVILIERVYSTKAAHRYLYVLAAGGTVLALIGIYQGLVLKIPRPPDLYHPIHGGSILLFSAVVLIALLFSDTGFFTKASIVAMLGMHGATLYLNSSRSVWLALASVLVLVPFLCFSRKKIKILYVGALVTLLVVVSAFKGNLLNDRIREAMNDIVAYNSSKSDTSLGARFEMWKASALMLKENPVLGIGTGDWDREMHEMVAQHKAPAFITQFSQPHSIYIDALSTKGLIGFLSLLMLLACPVYYALRCRQPETVLFSNIVVFATVAFCVIGLTDTIIRFRFVVMTYNLIIGLGLAVLIRSCGNTRELLFSKASAKK